MLESHGSPVKVQITKLMKDIISINFERELKKAKCEHGSHLCPNHIMKIFKKVIAKYTVVID